MCGSGTNTASVLPTNALDAMNEPNNWMGQRVNYVEYVPGQVGTQYEDILKNDKSLFAVRPNQPEPKKESKDFIDRT